MNRFRAACVVAVVLGLPGRGANALRADADCTEWASYGTWGNPAFIVSTAILERVEGSGNIEVERATSETLLSGPSEYLARGSWQSPFTAGTYRLRVERTLYEHATTVVSSAERSSWPAAYVKTAQATGLSFPCGTNPPVIISSPILAAAVGQAYSYSFQAHQSGGAVGYLLLVGPQGFAVDYASGSATWTPGQDQVGDKPVVLLAYGSNGQGRLHPYVIHTTAVVNHPPRITSTPVTSAREDEQYTDTVVAEDDDLGDVLTFDLIAAPMGMTIHPAAGSL